MKSEYVISLLRKAYASEMETVQNYLANSVWLDGLRAQEIVEALSEDVEVELGHARMLARRIKQLGGCPAGSMALVDTQETLQPGEDSTDLRHVVSGVLLAERNAIALYREIISTCAEDDPVTADLAVRLMADEEGHRTLFEGFLKSLNKDEPLKAVDDLAELRR